MAEDVRQEVEIKLGDKTFSVRPTFRVIAGIEGALSQPCRTLGIKCLIYSIPPGERGPGTEEISLIEISTIIFHMLRGQPGSPTSVDEVGAMILDEGYSQFCGPVSDFLLRANRGNKWHAQETERKAKIAKEEAERQAQLDPPTQRPPDPPA